MSLVKRALKRTPTADVNEVSASKEPNQGTEEAKRLVSSAISPSSAAAHYGSEQPDFETKFLFSHKLGSE